MPINLYTGLQGSGKSYEVVSSVIVEAVKAGRRVVTNIDGVNSERIRHYVALRDGIDLDKLGHVSHCQNDDIKKPGFFPISNESKAFVCPGDLVAIDEAWRFWGSGAKPMGEHEIFFREHRHFVHPVTKVSCDIVLMTQSASDLNKFVKDVIETSFRTSKLKELGLSTRYRVDSYSGPRQRVARRTNSWQKKYDAEIFALYQSYEGGVGVEKTIDDRQNLLKDKRLYGYAALLLLAFGSSGWWLYHLVNKNSAKPAPVTAAAATSTPAAPGARPAPAAAQTAPESDWSDTWRLVGSFAGKSGRFDLVANERGVLRSEPASAFQLSGVLRSGVIDGKRVALFSGPSGAMSQGGGPGPVSNAVPKGLP